MGTTTQTISYTLPADGFKSFFQGLLQGTNIPKVASTTSTQEEVVIVDDYVDLGAVQTQCQDALMTTIYTDVLCISTSVGWMLKDQSLSIYARRIEIKSPGHLDIVANFNTTSHAAVLMIFAVEIDGTINCYGEDSQLPSAKEFQVDQSTLGSGVMMRFDNGPVLANLETSEGLPLSGLTTSFQNYLTNEFIIGAMCMDEHPQLALAILKWTQQWMALASDSSSGSLLTELYYQSSSLVTLISTEQSAKQSGATWVPQLSNSVYSSMITALSTEISGYVTKYTNLMASNVTTDGLTQMMSAYETVQTNSEAQLQAFLTQAQSEYSTAEATVQQAKLNLSGTKVALVSKENSLRDVGFAQESQEIAFHIIKDLISFGANLATTLSKGPSAATSVVSSTESITNMAKLSSKLASSMQELGTCVKLTNDVCQFGTSVSSAVSGMSDPVSSGGSGGSTDSGGTTGSDGSPDDTTIVGELPSGSDMINVDAAWDTFKIHADDKLSGYVKSKVDYAQRCQEKMDDLVVYGKALQNAKNAAAQAAQKVANLQMQIKFAAKNKKSISDKIQAFTNEQTAIIELQQAFYKKILDAKLMLFSLWKSYQATYYYWALEPSSTQVSLKDLNSLLTDLNTSTALNFDKYKQLCSLNGKTEQVFHLTNVVIDDPNALSDLQSTGKAQWQMPITDSNFEGMNRVRFNTIRIWLDGEQLYSGSGPQSVNMKVQSSGVYADRTQDQQYVFNSVTFDDAIRYTVNNNSLNANRSLMNGLYGFMEIDGRSPINESNCFFEPTPFSQWSIDLTDQDNEISFEKISSITMEFVGSCIMN